MKYLLFSGSLRTDSLNKRLIEVTRKILSQKQTNHVTVADIRELSIPVYDGDIEEAGFPDGVKTLGTLVSETNALVIASPEYNGSIAGSLKNTIDWVSRLRPMPFAEKPVLLMGASTGNFGSIRGLSASRTPFENLGAFVYPQSLGVSRAHELLIDNTLVSEAMMMRLIETLEKFETFSHKLQK